MLSWWEKLAKPSSRRSFLIWALLHAAARSCARLGAMGLTVSCAAPARMGVPATTSLASVPAPQAGW